MHIERNRTADLTAKEFAHRMSPVFTNFTPSIEEAALHHQQWLSNAHNLLPTDASASSSSYVGPDGDFSLASYKEASRRGSGILRFPPFPGDQRSPGGLPSHPSRMVQRQNGLQFASF